MLLFRDMFEKSTNIHNTLYLSQGRNDVLTIRVDESWVLECYMQCGQSNNKKAQCMSITMRCVLMVVCFSHQLFTQKKQIDGISFTLMVWLLV